MPQLFGPHIFSATAWKIGLLQDRRNYAWQWHKQPRISSDLRTFLMSGIQQQCNINASTTQYTEWPTLEERRKKARLSLFYKAKNNLIALQIPSYYRTRQDETRLHHQSSFVCPYIRTSSHMNSFYPKTIKEWNALPTNIITSNSLILFQSNI